MTDPRFIPPSDREEDARRAYSRLHAINKLLDHAAFMDERDARQRDLIGNLRKVIETCDQVIGVCKSSQARQRDLIRRLAEQLSGAFTELEECAKHHRYDCDLEDKAFPKFREVLIEARGIEATNE